MLDKLFPGRVRSNRGGQEVVKRDLSEDKPLNLVKGVPDLLDLFAPDYFDRSHTTYFKMGKHFIKTLFLTALPREVRIGWLSPFLNHEGDIDVSVHINPYDEREAIDELTRVITKLEAASAFQRGNISMVAELRQAIDDAWGIRDLITNNLSRLFKVSIQANLYSTSLEDLEKEGAILEGRLGGRRIHARFAEGRMDEGFLSVSPLGLNLLDDTYRNLDSFALSTIFPFVTADLTHEGGYPLAINVYTGAPVFYNPYDSSLRNHNMAIYAGSGAGKSTAVKTKIGRAALLGERAVVIDPEGEYRGLAQGLGGIHFLIGPDSSHKLNPFEIAPEYDEKRGQWVIRLIDKYLDLIDLIGTMAGGLTPEESSLVEETVREEYEALGITTDPESLYQRPSVYDVDRGVLSHAKVEKMPPRLSTFYQRLGTKGERAERLVSILTRYLEGGTLGFFDCYSNIKPQDLEQAPVVVFDVSQLEEGLARPLGMHVVLSWIWEKFVKKNPRIKKRVVVDEAWMFVNYAPTMNFLEKMVRRARKRSCGLDVISQDFVKFANHPQAQAIHTNTDTFLFMKQKETDIDALCSTFHLSEGEGQFLMSCGVGEGILRVGTSSVAIRVVNIPLEKRWVYTTPLLEDDEDEGAIA